MNKIYVARSKRSGNYFIFVEYYEDGWGKYEDIANLQYPDTLQVFSSYQIKDGLRESLSHDGSECSLAGYIFKNHTKDEIEFVELLIGEIYKI
jgi:hypothetical protein